MTPIKFASTNTVWAKDQPEYLPLPAHNGADGVVTTCWKLNLRDRLKMLFTGRLWLQQLAFGNPLQPQKPSADRPTLVDQGVQAGRSQVTSSCRRPPSSPCGSSAGRAGGAGCISKDHRRRHGWSPLYC